MLSLRRTGSRFSLVFLLFIAAPAVAQNGSDSGPASKPTPQGAFILDEPRDRANAPLIVGGTPAGPTDNPFQVGLLKKRVPDNFSAQFCGGTLIAPDVIVTAAHCGYYQKTRNGPLIALRADEVQVLTGTRSLSQGGVRREVVSIWLHPNYNPDNHDYDVAVWKLQSRAEGIPLASLAVSDGIPGSGLLVTGWGHTSEGGTGSAVLLKISVPVVSHEACSALYKKFNREVTPRMLCAGFKAGGKDSCQGDSGGPATRGTGSTILTGVVSWGEGCAQPDRYGVYARVSDPSIRDFIRGHLN